MDTSELPRILSIEDDSDTRLLLKHLLEDVYEVTFASDAQEALDAVESAPFDLLLVDINLGEGISGTEFLQRIREREEPVEVPAVALTAYNMPGDREDLLNKGFEGYVGKPFVRDQLVDAIEETL